MNITIPILKWDEGSSWSIQQVHEEIKALLRSLNIDKFFIMQILQQQHNRKEWCIKLDLFNQFESQYGIGMLGYTHACNRQGQ